MCHFSYSLIIRENRRGKDKIDHETDITVESNGDFFCGVIFDDKQSFNSNFCVNCGIFE